MTSNQGHFRACLYAAFFKFLMYTCHSKRISHETKGTGGSICINAHWNIGTTYGISQTFSPHPTLCMRPFKMFSSDGKQTDK